MNGIERKSVVWVEESVAGSDLLDRKPKPVEVFGGWFDRNSDFFGAYENIDAQSEGKIVYPTLE